MRLVKGHGTQNDFLVLPDLDGEVELTPAMVRALCDRRAGVGADGVLRVVRSENDPDSARYAPDAPFFMDYRNADGSVAEMCGNGVRVFVRYLQRGSLVEQEAAVATRGGIRCARAGTDGHVAVQMGSPRFLADRPIATAAPHTPLVGTALEIPNPHVVVALDSLDELAALDLTRAPVVEPALPHGQNVEFVVRVASRHLRLRVHERGVGETRSCGTGICAAAVAAATADGVGADGVPWRVDVPGGTCTVRWDDAGVELTGPAVLVGDVEVDDAWLAAAAGAAEIGGTAAPARATMERR
ncbi:diaminopimelate epimerase [Jatrophihabitans endophyticus]|uniref:Diaminopimelate epimerase n=1 Tax=Jatrophihabitans endophyticus TaxID=1206085 RepID=A0A1M5LVZ3_9ACTN|nr:diaminopimelate epimerase [Jatrophihabitans endophyticus]SHG69191.1 diaminopimelate epimerase [Jatrophihabitans endophyticus]